MPLASSMDSGKAQREKSYKPEDLLEDPDFTYLRGKMVKVSLRENPRSFSSKGRGFDEKISLGLLVRFNPDMF